MSTSILYHGFGVRGYEYRRTAYRKGHLEIGIERRSEEIVCPRCGGREVIRRGTVERTLKTVPIGRKAVFLKVTVQRVWCRQCRTVQQTPLGISDPYRSYTKAFERYARDLCRSMTILDVACHLGVSWDVIKDIVQRYLTAKFGKPNVKNVRILAIDEIALRKGQRYLTVVLNWETGRVLFVGDGKGAEALKPFWAMLGKRRRKRVQAVAIDMGPAYIEAVREALPQAAIVFDHFHVVKLFHEKLSELRRRAQNEAETKQKKEVLKGTRWLLLKNPEHLDTKRNERERLEEALRLNEPLMVGYYLKEDLRQIWDQADRATAERVLLDWMKRAEVSGIPILIKFAHLLAAHRSGILAYYDHRISTGRLEGINNKIKTMKRQAYGFHDLEFFKLRILGIHETKYALVG
jgi:transposase